MELRLRGPRREPSSPDLRILPLATIGRLRSRSRPRGGTDVNLAKILAEIEKKRAELQKELSRLEEAAKALRGLAVGHTRRSAGGRRRMSAAGRKRISEAQKARWAKVKRQKRAA